VGGGHHIPTPSHALFPDWPNMGSYNIFHMTELTHLYLSAARGRQIHGKTDSLPIKTAMQLVH